MAKAQRKEEEESKDAPAPAAPEAVVSAQAVEPWEAPPKLGRTSLYVVLGVVVLFNLPLLHYFLLRSPMATNQALPFNDDFADPATVAGKYFSTGGQWRVVNGELLSPGVKNNPLWLRASLPNDVAVEFDVRSMSPEGDIKVEIFGDGSDHASGYVLIHGGWNNALSIIARLDEHAPSVQALQQTGALKNYTMDTRVRVEATPFRVDLGRRYHWRIERRGKVISWSIDGTPFMSFEDPMPLTGKGHDRFGFSSWEAQLYFDNLTVTAL